MQIRKNIKRTFQFAVEILYLSWYLILDYIYKNIFLTDCVFKAFYSVPEYNLNIFRVSILNSNQNLI